MTFQCVFDKNYYENRSSISELIEFRKDYTYIEELDAYYKQHKIKEEWNDALSVCREEGAEMLIPRSKFELEKLNRFNMSFYWLSYQDIYSSGHFVAADGIITFL